MISQQYSGQEIGPADDADLHREFLGLFSASAGRLYSYVLCLMGQAADADEAFQEVSYLLWTKFDQFDRQRSFLNWARGIAHFVVLKHRRSARRQLLLDDATLELVAAEASERLDREGEQRQALGHCLEKLSAGDRQILRLRYDLQLKPKEISRRQGRSVHSVYRSLARIHQLLQACIQRSMREVTL